MSLQEDFKRQGHGSRPGGNAPLLLNGKPDVWFVASGGVDIFAVRTTANELAGRRHHLLRITQGQVFFGINQAVEDKGSGLLAVGVPGAEIYRMSVTLFLELASREHNLRDAALMIDGWIEAVTRTRGLESLKENTFYSADKTALIGSKDFWQKIDVFHSLVLQCIGDAINKEEQAEYERLKGKHLVDQRAIESAVYALTRVMEMKTSYGGHMDSEEDPLLTACRLVIEKMGASIRGSLRTGGAADETGAINALAMSSRIRIRRIALRGIWWRQDNGPILAFKTGEEGPVALIPDSSLRYEMVDPKMHTSIPVTEDTASGLSPFGYVFYPPFPERALTAINLLRLGLSNCLTKDIVMIFLLGIVAGILGMITPVATGFIIDTIIPGVQRHELLHLAGLLFVIAFVSSLFQLSRGLAVLRVETRMGVAVQAGVWDRLLSLPVPFFRKYLAGDLALRSLGIDAIRQIMTGSAVSSLLSAIFSVFNLFLLFFYSWRLALMAIVLVCLAVLATNLASWFEIKYQRRLQEIQGRISGMVFQMINGIAKLRVAGAEARAFTVWARDFSGQKRLNFKARTVANRLAVFNAAFPVIASAIIFALAAYSISGAGKDGTLTTGDFLAFNAAFMQFLTAGLEMGAVLVSILQIIPIYERAKPIMDEVPEIDTAKGDPGELRGNIEISNVSFRYHKESPLILDSVSLKVGPGEHVAIVGPSGAGKSTIFRLLIGFESPESGSVYYDRQDFTALNVQAVRRQIGVVLQNGQVMPGSIFENIVGSAPLTLEDAWEAARMAGLDADIERMPMGMHTFIPEGGSTLSGGQKQRLLIARAVVTRPKILLFDEATSALDNETQTQVSESLDKLKVTRVVIAHRLSTIINADRIYVLAHGRIAQTGTYSELMKEPGLFQDLAKRQIV